MRKDRTEAAAPRDAASETLDLKGCPFCGAPPTAEPWHGGGPSKTMVACSGERCPVSPQTTGATPREAQARWNGRQTVANTRVFRVFVTKQ